MPKGGARPGAGRKAGVPNKATADIKAIARDHTAKAIKTLIKLVDREDSPATQLGAARELLDRAYGKPSQVVAGDADAPLIFQEIRRTLVRPGHPDR